MSNLFIVYVFFFALFALLGLIIVHNKKVNTDIRFSLFLLLISISIWLLCNAMVQISSSNESVWFWHETKFIGVFIVPGANLFFTLYYIKAGKNFYKWLKVVIVSLSVLFIGFAITNPWTGFFRVTYEVHKSGDLIYVLTENGLGYYLSTGISYTMIAVSTILLIRQGIKSPKYYRTQPLLLAFGILVPIGLNISYNYRLLGEPYDYTAVGFILTGILYYVVTVYFGVPDVLPIARKIVVDNLKDVIFICNNDGFIIDYNERAVEEIERYDFVTTDMTFDEGFQKVLDLGHSKLVPFNNKHVYEFLNEGIYMYYELSRSDILEKEHQLGELIIFHDVTESYIMLKKLENMAVKDQLTNLYNRNYFSEFMKVIDYPIGIIFGGINSFKLINESFGHDVGDDILKRIAEIFLKLSPDDSVVGRYGGDEFLMIIPSQYVNEIQAISESILEKVNDINIQNTNISICLISEVFDQGNKNIGDMISIVQKSMDKKKLLETNSSKSAIVESLRLTLEQSDYETKQHTDRTTALATLIGKKVGLSGQALNELSMLAALHDIGKVSIPDSILLKPGKLTYEEFEIMKTHTQKGYQIALSSPDLVPIADGILHHHEKYDGTGYPDGLKGEEISIETRIITLVDSFDVMVNDRPYKNAMTIEEAIVEMRECSGNHFDPDLVEILIDIIENE